MSRTKVKNKELILWDFPVLIANTEGMPVDKWQELRRLGIGGSDAAKTIGMSRYGGPIGVYYDKLGNLPDKAEGNERLRQKFRAGHLVEPVIAAMFEEDTGKKVVRQPYMFQHPTHKYMLANVDFGVPDELAGLECKNSAVRKEWADGMVPIEYYIQCQHYMAVTGAQRWYIAFLLDGWQFDYRTIDRDDEIIKQLVEDEGKLWYEYVIPGIPPEIDGTEESKALLRHLYPAPEEGKELKLADDSLDQLWDEKDALQAQITELEKQKALYDNKIKALIADNSLVETPYSLVKMSLITVKEKVSAGYSYTRPYRKVKKID